MRANGCVQATVGDAQPFHWPTVHQMLLHNFRGIFGLHVSIPNSLGINDDGGPVLALVQAARFVDADASGEAGSLGLLLKSGVNGAVAVGSAGRTWCAGRTGIGTDKDVTFKSRQLGSPPSPE